MTWAYLSTAPASSDKSWVRLRIGDTSSGDQLLQDEEINALISIGGDKHMGAALAAETVGGYFARRADKTVGKLSISFGKVSESFFALAERLRTESNYGATPYAGGISESDMETDEDDTDLPARLFSLGQFDNRGDQST